MIHDLTATAPAPVIILSPPRSCSTLAVAMLSGHPDLCGLPELSLFPSEPLQRLLVTRFSTDSDYGRWHRRALLRALAWARYGSLASADLDAAAAELAGMAALDSAEIMRAVIAMVAPRILVEKSPKTAGSDRALADCLRAFPHAHYVHLVRDPVTVARSQVRNHRRIGLYPHMTDRQLFLLAIRNWYITHHRVRTGLSALNCSQWSCINAEDLCGEPERTLTALLARLGLDQRPAVVDQMLRTETWPFASGPDGAYGGDPLFFQNPRFRRAERSSVKPPTSVSGALEEVLPPDCLKTFDDFANSLRNRGSELLNA